MIPVDNSATVSVTSKGLGLQAKFNPTDLNEYVNPPADPRLNSILKKMGSPLKQGIIQQTDEVVGGPQRYPFACRFMFNPTSINVAMSASEGLVDYASLTPAQAAAIPFGVGNTGIGFDLLFDRTYEVAYGPTATNPRDLRDLGVYRDIAALEAVVGARQEFTGEAKSVIQSMRLVPVYVIFGGGNGNVGLSFVGTITGFSITYSIFSERMVPMRAAVESIQVTQLLGQDLSSFVTNGGTLLQRAHAPNRVVTASGSNTRSTTLNSNGVPLSTLTRN